MGHKFCHLTKTDRYKIEALLKAGMTYAAIARVLNVHRSTISREVRRARSTFMRTNLTLEERYNPDLAQARYEMHLAGKGGQLKIANDHGFAVYIEKKIMDEHLSPAAALNSVRLDGKEFKTSICRNTLYSYIDKGIFLNLTNKQLPIKGKRKRLYRKVRVLKRAPRGDSIEKRDPAILDRLEFGHWEGDTVYGGKGQSTACLFVFTERKTRMNMILRMPDRTAQSGVKAMDLLQQRFGSRFKRIFKTITFDNGGEFADTPGLERDLFAPDRIRTKIYYCHPYSSYERGSCERQNGMIRRIYPKGTDFGALTAGDITRLEAWLNRYPRKILGWDTAERAFNRELAG